ncbi:MAG: GC-type dockerin domain-anchored protein, partial [Phycisphaerales bacterium]
LSSGQQVRIRVSHFGSNAFRVGNGVTATHVSFVCIADFNNDGRVNSQDFFDFITAFFALNQAADVNLDGAINSQDFFDFLTGLFAGC